MSSGFTKFLLDAQAFARSTNRFYAWRTIMFIHFLLPEIVCTMHPLAHLDFHPLTSLLIWPLANFDLLWCRGYPAHSFWGIKSLSYCRWSLLSFAAEGCDSDFSHCGSFRTDFRWFSNKVARRLVLFILMKDVRWFGYIMVYPKLAKFNCICTLKVHLCGEKLRNLFVWRGNDRLSSIQHLYYFNMPCQKQISSSWFEPALSGSQIHENWRVTCFCDFISRVISCFIKPWSNLII